MNIRTEYYGTLLIALEDSIERHKTDLAEAKTDRQRFFTKWALSQLEDMKEELAKAKG